MTTSVGPPGEIDALASHRHALTHAYDVESLDFRYSTSRSADAPSALRDVTFSVESGETLGIVGPNGSGKTSLLKLLAKIVPLQQGQVRLFGESLSALPQEEVARTITFVPQHTHPGLPFTVAETVLMGRFPHHRHTPWTLGFGWESEKDRAIAQQAMITMDVWHLAQRVITELSGGERQRVVMARALAQEPRVLLLDEPTAFLDLQHQIEICNVLHRLKREGGLTVLVVSHDLNLASQYCDRLMLLDQGRIVKLGCPDDVIQPDVLKSVYRCQVLVDRHPVSGVPRITLPGHPS